MAELLHDLLTEAAARRPAATAVRDADGAWTYAELDRAADACAAWLADRDVRPGDRVLARLGNSRPFVALLFGALRAGAVFVPVGTAMKRFHLARVMADAEPSLVVAEGADTGLLTELGTAPVHDLAELPDADAAHRGRVPVRADDLALLMYTSGSTSMPKAVMTPHRAAVFVTGAIAERLGYRAQDVVLNAIPFSFDYGLYQIFLTVAAGAELVVSRTDSHVGLMTLLHRHAVTVFPVVPSLAELVLRLAARDGRQASTVRLFTSTGAAFNRPVIDGLRAAFPGARIAPMYGTTECKRITVLEPDGDLDRPHSVGRALTGTQVLVLDDAGRPLPPGATGEIAVRGPHVMAGYWRAPGITGERFRTDPRTGTVTLHTGDYGRLDADGHLYVEGRRDDLFKRRGVRMSALEIEAAALDVPGVRAAALLPPADGADMVLYVAAGRPAAEVLALLAERLEPAKVPPVCHVRAELPLTPNGKTDKKALAAEPPAPAARSAA
ncbi:AMP-binding protein [Streptomyces sp. 5-8]|uniref:AMP-binding protein n=1 Tax=Streptomyces musisoli TaxID=2802280 RepID=A0ABS1P3E2_9ACTN|nr:MULTISPECIES: AMP-binding protein [Streptomyces]MBL1106872.1 AMP-binding protein [Streptomyces musisoli]MBY8844859.1 AMP-binding protein [Streptomyces sp. SP2-10]